MAIHSSAQTIFGFIEIDLTLGVGEEADEIPGGVSGIGM
jgi:hypothetical protein